MNYIDLAQLLGVYVNKDSYTYQNSFRKYMDRGEGINNSNQLTYREYIIEDIRNLRNQVEELQDQVNEIKHLLNKESE